jgi:hypothetical protein
MIAPSNNSPTDVAGEGSLAAIGATVVMVWGLKPDG